MALTNVYRQTTSFVFNNTLTKGVLIRSLVANASSSTQPSASSPSVPKPPNPNAASSASKPSAEQYPIIKEQQPQTKESEQHQKQTQQRLSPTSTVKDSKTLAKEAKKSTSFIMNLFRGQLYTDELFPYPDVLNEEQKDNVKMLIDPIWKFFEEKNNAAKNDQLEAIPDDVMTGLKEQGAFGIQVPYEYGGLSLTNTQAARLFEVVSAHDLGISICLGAHQSIGFKGILLFGNEQQKQKYLPKLAAGEWVAAFCLTEPSAGSDAASIKTKAELSSDGKYYVLNGSKIWISNAGIAEIFTVFAQTPVVDDKTGQTQNKVTAFIVERKFGGIQHGQPEKKMGIKASNTAELFFEDCKVPVENVLGGVGEGFKVAMNILNNGRFGMVVGLSGTMKMAIRKSIDFAKNRRQFGRTVDSYENVQEKLVRMAMRQYVTESLGFLLSSNMDRGVTEYQCEAAIGKIFASESAWFVLDEAIQIHGGMGYMRHTGLERVMRDLRIFRIFEGANDILRLFVALTGMQYAGLHLRELAKSVKSFNLNVLMGEGTKRLRRVTGMSSGPSLSAHLHPSLQKSGELLSKSIDRFGYTIENVLIKYGKSIRDEQFITVRIGEAVIDLFTMAVALSRCTHSFKKNVSTAVHESNLVNLWCEEAYARINTNLDLITDPAFLKRSKLMTTLAREIVEKESTVPEHPLGF
ncbi:unnamed protein product [Didymodactylos carnosus]|uniref:Very long-chain specific acyl-CoA dehydrogenase, mitochondrial n=1 Tax=Didymodactylos carnosus TaxID=1234261 RepID=A0A814JA51_9BILA|nr:unnamed protein product [Didymodactylos carnosus]CAF1035464.1 unnamed protein product [Didymodactylos carnosus]CAF3694251.1 unnamed protein product [Didymodactylos carnosus]CAF3806075.1 unnamed protein product [Didymodactylos carnosus]